MTFEVDHLQQELKTIEAKSSKIKEEIYNLIKSELERLLKEFKHNDYAKRYNTTVEKVTKALICHEHSTQDLTKIMKGQKQLKVMTQR